MNKKIILISIIFAFLIALIPLRADWSFDKSLRDGLVSIKLFSISYRLNYCSADYYNYRCSGNYRQRQFCSTRYGCGSWSNYTNCGSRTCSSTTYYCSGNQVRGKYSCSGGCSGTDCQETSYYDYSSTNCGSRTCSSTTYYCSGNQVRGKYSCSGGCSGGSCQATSYYDYSSTNCGSRTCSSTTYYCSGNQVRGKYSCSGGCSGGDCQATSYYDYLSENCGSVSCTSNTYYCSGTDRRYKYSCSGGCSGGSCQNTRYYDYLSENCGSDECGSWGSNYCKDNDVYHKRICVRRGCLGSDCYERTEGDEQKVEDCPLGCSGGECVEAGGCLRDSDCPNCYYCGLLFKCIPSWGRIDYVCGHNLASYGSYCYQQKGNYNMCVTSSRLCKGSVSCGSGNNCYIYENYYACGTSDWSEDSWSDYQCSGNWLQRGWINRWCNASPEWRCEAVLTWKNYEYCGSGDYEYRCSGNWVQDRYVNKKCDDITEKCWTLPTSWSNKEDCGTSSYEYRYSGGWQQRQWCDRGCLNDSCYENCSPWANYLQGCGHTCLSHGTASVAWPDCSCQNLSPASGYEKIGTWNTYDCGNNCTGYRKIGCSCDWVNGSCGGGSCSAAQRQQTLTCTPSGCDSGSRCVSDSACGCSCDWVNGSCGGGSCPATKRQQTLVCTPSGCDSGSQCVSDSACVTPAPTLNLTANPSSIIQGQFSTLQWSSVNTTSCTWTGGLSGSEPTSGSKGVNPSTTTTYSMSCTGPGGNASGSAVVNVSSLSNQSPLAANLKVVQPDYCLSGPAGIFSWTFSDPDPGDTQSAYQVQVDNNSDFSSPEDDSGKVSSTSNSYATILGKLNYNNTYYWRVKVWDNKNAESAWISGPNFTTPVHAYPSIDFSWAPQIPGANEDVLFTDKSTVYGGATKLSWSWTFQDGSPASSSQQNPTVKFSSIGEKLITLRVTDSDGYSCSRSETLNAEFPLPKWKEIAPF